MKKYFALIVFLLPVIMSEAKTAKLDPENTLTIELKDGKVITDLSSTFSTLLNLIGHFGLSLYKFESPVDSVTSVHLESNKV